jgi:hypothetical protein
MPGMNKIKTSVGKDNGFTVFPKLFRNGGYIRKRDNLIGNWCHTPLLFLSSM